MTLTWDDVEKAILARDVAGMTRLLVEADESERVALAVAVENGSEVLDGRGAIAGALYGLAAIGCLPTAAKVAALFGKGAMAWAWGQVPPGAAVTIGCARGVNWLGELGSLLLERLDARIIDVGRWQLVRALLEADGVGYPVTETVVRHWLNAIPIGQSTYDLLVGEPRIEVFLTVLFEMDGIGSRLDRTLRVRNGPPVGVFPAAVERLIADGRVDRATVLAATVERLVRGDGPEHLRPFVQLLEALAPTGSEAAASVDGYVRLVQGGSSSLVRLAQKALRAVDEAGLLPVEVLLEVGGAVLVRKEKVVIKAQLVWLDKAAARQPARAGEICEVVALGFDQPSFELQERALAVIARHAARLDQATTDRLAGLASGLGADLASRAAELFAGTVVPAEIPADVALPALTSSAAAPGAIASGAELASEVAALLRDGDPVRWERVLAGLVAMRDQDLGAVLGPVVAREQFWGRTYAARLADLIALLTGSAKGPDPQWWETVEAVRQLERTGSRSGIESALVTGAPDGLLLRRMVEIGSPPGSTRRRQGAALPPMLVATPTHVNGNLDAAVLLHRLRRAEAEGWEPLPVDFEQALLRVPRSVEPAVVAGAQALKSGAGRRFAGWLGAGGLPDPISIRFTPANPRLRQRIVAELRPAASGGGLTDAERELVTLTREDGVKYTAAGFYYYDESRLPAFVPSVLPHHREVAAAWLLPRFSELVGEYDDLRGPGAELVLLAECDGPVGPAMTLATVYVMGAKHAVDRAAAVDAFLMLAGTSDWPAAVGAEIAALTASGMLKLNRIVAALTDAHQGGAGAAVWEVLAAAISPLLSSTVPRGLPDLLELASRIAGERGIRGELPGIEPRRGSTRLIKETNRLHAVLTGPKGVSR